jgi:hypothetical protein
MVLRDTPIIGGRGGNHKLAAEPEFGGGLSAESAIFAVFQGKFCGGRKGPSHIRAACGLKASRGDVRNWDDMLSRNKNMPTLAIEHRCFA